MGTKHDHRHSQRGLTLIEAAIVLVVTAIVAATAAPALSKLIEARRLDAAAHQLAADVQLVRSEAVARNQPIRLSFHGDSQSTCWVVHTGAAAQCSCAGGSGPAVCTGGANEIKTVVLGAAERVTVQANVASMLFDPLHGTATPAGTLRLVDGNGRAIHHIVNVMGRVRSCTPSGVAGWRAC
jgi:type IV fimbrial biogenesis protein FimT